MRPTRLITLSLLAVTSAMSFASSDELLPKTLTLEPTSKLSLDPSLTQPLVGNQGAAIAGAAAIVFGKPSIGVRVGVGDWSNLILDGGLDFTFKLPILPVPALRIDAEAWSEFSNFGDRHGNAVSLLAMESFTSFYAGIGPSYYFSDDYGDHSSGFAAKLLAGVNLPDSTFVELSGLIGETPTPIFLSIGKRF